MAIIPQQDQRLIGRADRVGLVLLVGRSTLVGLSARVGLLLLVSFAGALESPRLLFVVGLFRIILASI
jgi:hypothetical protein